MLTSLRFSQRILLLPLLGGLAGVCVISTALMTGRLNQKLVVQIEDGLIPAVQAHRDLQKILVSVPRALQNAVAADDLAILDEADALRDLFVAGVAALPEHSTADTTGSEELWLSFESYYSEAREVSERMISGEGGDRAALSRRYGFSSAGGRGVLRHQSPGDHLQRYGQKRSFGEFLRRMGSLHRRLYDQGAMETELGSDGRSCVVHLRGAPSYPETDLWVAQGFYMGAARHFGLSNVSCCHRREGGGASFQFRWS